MHPLIKHFQCTKENRYITMLCRVAGQQIPRQRAWTAIALETARFDTKQKLRPFANNFTDQEQKRSLKYLHRHILKSIPNVLICFSHLRPTFTELDPYHSIHAANGLAFSVPLGVKHPPSLVNIFRELESDLNTAYPILGELDSWAKQGVLLLNTALTVESAKPNSHQKEDNECCNPSSNSLICIRAIF